jgi:hypothetical protein
MEQENRIKRIEKAIRRKNNWTRGSTKDFMQHKDLSRIEKDRHATERMPQSSNFSKREKDTS